MENLPVEIIEKILSNLDVSDLLSCASVNTLWRNAANQNHLWRAQCATVFSIDPNSKPIIEAKCRVEPHFKIPTNRSERLTDICPWRIRYAQEIHVYKNWKNGRYVQTDFPDDLENAKRFDCHFIGHTLISKTTEFDVWNFKDNLTAVDPIKPCVPGDVDLFIPIKNGFAYIQKGLLTYYTMKNDQFFLKIQTSIDKPLLKKNVPIVVEDVETFIKELPPFELHKTRICCNERYLIASRVINENVTFVVWDLKLLNASVFHVPVRSHFEHVYMGFSEGQSSKFYISFFHRDATKHLTESDMIYIFDLKMPDSCQKVVVDPMDEINIKPMGDFVAIGYDDKVSFVRDGKISSIESNLSGPYFQDRILTTRSYVCALGRNGENLELILTDLNFKIIRRLNFWKPVEFYLDYTLNSVGHDLVAVVDQASEVGQLWDLQGQRRSNFDSNLLTSATPSNNKIVLDFLWRKVYYFW